MLEESDRCICRDAWGPDPEHPLIVAIVVLKRIALVLVPRLSDELLEGLMKVFILPGVGKPRPSMHIVPYWLGHLPIILVLLLLLLDSEVARERRNVDGAAEILTVYESKRVIFVPITAG